MCQRSFHVRATGSREYRGQTAARRRTTQPIPGATVSHGMRQSEKRGAGLPRARGWKRMVRVQIDTGPSLDTLPLAIEQRAKLRIVQPRLNHRKDGAVAAFARLAFDDAA